MASYDFYQAYAGPLGPHLNRLTQFTRTRDESKRLGFGIHERVHNGVTAHRKENTCSPVRKTTLARKIAAVAAHVERHPNSAPAKAHLAKLQARAAA